MGDGVGKNVRRVKQRQETDKETCNSLWRALKELVKKVDPGYIFTSVQVNCNFKGKPLRDRGDHSYQYAISLGDFSGGQLVMETDDPQKLVQIDTKNRLTKCDGRRVHWVTPYRGKRYSLIMYRNVGKLTPLLSNRGQDSNAHEFQRGQSRSFSKGKL